MVGTVIRVIENRGFAFVHPDGEPNDLFLHYKAADRSLIFDRSLEGTRLEFDVRAEKDGRLRAVNARRAS